MLYSREHSHDGGNSGGRVGAEVELHGSVAGMLSDQEKEFLALRGLSSSADEDDDTNASPSPWSEP